MSADRSEPLGRPVSLLKSLQLMWGMRRYLRERRKQDAPLAVLLGERASAVRRKAEALSREGREDFGAVQELRKLAGHRRRPLPDAALSLRAGNLNLEVRHFNRAYRLLQAAQKRQPVIPEDASLTPLFDQIQYLDVLGAEAAFAELAAKEPRLLAVQKSSVTYRSGLSPDQLREVALEHQRVCTELEPILGPKRGSFDALLSTQMAQSFAARHLSNWQAAKPPADGQPTAPAGAD